MTDGVEYKEIEQADSQMIAAQLARVTINMVHSLYGADRARFRRMSRLILAEIPPALRAEIKSDEAFTRSNLWCTHRKSRGKV